MDKIYTYNFWKIFKLFIVFIFIFQIPTEEAIAVTTGSDNPSIDPTNFVKSMMIQNPGMAQPTTVQATAIAQGLFHTNPAYQCPAAPSCMSNILQSTATCPNVCWVTAVVNASTPNQPYSNIYCPNGYSVLNVVRTDTYFSRQPRTVYPTTIAERNTLQSAGYSCPSSGNPVERCGTPGSGSYERDNAVWDISWTNPTCQSSGCVGLWCAQNCCADWCCAGYQYVTRAYRVECHITGYFGENALNPDQSGYKQAPTAIICTRIINPWVVSPS